MNALPSLIIDERVRDERERRAALVFLTPPPIRGDVNIGAVAELFELEEGKVAINCLRSGKRCGAFIRISYK
jgi:hypothetical protein